MNGAPSPSWTHVAGDRTNGLLLIADHASNHVPDGIWLGVAERAMDQHMAIDIGVDPLGRVLCAMLAMPGIFGAVSRLVIDLNREAESPTLIPLASDGHDLLGNIALDEPAKAARVDAYWRPYHANISDLIALDRPKLLVSLHSFTPSLSTRPEEERPWQVGVLYNQDERAARIAIPMLEQAGIMTGDNLPYSGKVLNATMNSHGEGNGIAYLGLEVRQDLIDHDEGVAHWAAVLKPVIVAVRDSLA